MRGAAGAVKSGEHEIYFSSVFCLAAPVGSIVIEHSLFHAAAPLMSLVGKWFVFWGAGVRIALAG
jgi:hypothetical protein